ncbi:MAG: hypothetical protein OEX07_09370 [Gammaproteobacteria bacterium]|nr:hypothetical protein [Gammaproteobacteria bacterium]
MKDLAQLAIYGTLTIGAIMVLITMSRMENLSSSTLVLTAMLLIIVLPVVIAIQVAKKERKNKS